jgi:exopolysaccharide biosynthesis polyprenyl glycosylphosphotransferase
MVIMRRNLFGHVADSLIASALIVAVVVWVDERQPHFPGVAEFLHMRLTLTNVCFALAFSLIWAECFKAVGVLIQSHRGFFSRFFVVAAGCAAMTAILSLYLALGWSHVPTLQIIEDFFAVALSCQTLRLIAWLNGWSGRSDAQQDVIILGSGQRASRAWRELRIGYGGTINLLGFVDDRNPDLMAPDIAQRYLCDIDQLSSFLLRNSVQQMIVATPLRSTYDMTQRAISIAEAAGLRVLCMPDSFTLVHGRSFAKRASAFVELLPQDEQFQLTDRLKRYLDIIFSAAGLVILSPVFLVVALAVKVSSPGPVFFLQERYGYHRRRFRMVKFRSMVENAPQLMAQLERENEADGPIFKIKKDPRVTTVGRFIRSTSLDELPQLWNVLRGEMSLVGPRPMSVRDVSRFSEAQLMRRFSVRPGMTGLWQVSGRSSLTFDNWIALDFRYIDEWSLGLDLMILARTLPAVLKRSGAA